MNKRQYLGLKTLMDTLYNFEISFEVAYTYEPYCEVELSSGIEIGIGGDFYNLPTDFEWGDIDALLSHYDYNALDD